MKQYSVDVGGSSCCFLSLAEDSLLICVYRMQSNNFQAVVGSEQLVHVNSCQTSCFQSFQYQTVSRKFMMVHVTLYNCRIRCCVQCMSDRIHIP